jgi:hypothetical protein
LFLPVYGIALAQFALKHNWWDLVFSLVFLALSIRSLVTFFRESNSWHSNITPVTFEHLQKGSWMVMGVSLNQLSPYDEAVYVTIAETPASDRAISTLRLHATWIDIRDYKSIVNGKQPRSVTIGERGVTFSWPEEAQLPSTM